MIFLGLLRAAEVSAEQAVPISAADPFPALPRILTLTDYFVQGLALVVISVAVLNWLKSRQDPLRTAPRRDNRFDELSLGIAVLAYFSVPLLFLAAMKAAGQNDEKLFARPIIGIVAQLTIIFVCLWLSAVQYAGGITKLIKGPGRLSRSTVWIVVLTPVALAGSQWILEATVHIWRYFFPGYVFPMHSTIEHLHDETAGRATIIGLWLSAVAFAPLAEELFFRGLIQTLLVNFLGKRWPAILLSSCAFAAVHLAQPHALPALFALSLLLGFAYERTGALIVSLWVHALFNLRTLIWNTLAINSAS